MSSRAIAAVAVLCLIAVIGMFAWAADGDADLAREHDSMLPCMPPVLVLERPPPGARKVSLDPFISGSHHQVWEIGEGFLEVTSGAYETAVVLGDETAEIRGHIAEVGRLDIAAEDYPHVVFRGWNSTRSAVSLVTPSRPTSYPHQSSSTSPGP